MIAWEFLKIVTVNPSDEIGLICRDTECSVCLAIMNPDNAQAAPCGHRYHATCYSLLKRCKPVCPHCHGLL